MSCYYPLWGKPPAEAGGKTTFSALQPTTARGVLRLQAHGLMPIPCGKCYGCRSNLRLQWTIRCTHEASLHDKSSFLTLTISDDNLPWHGSLDRPLLQKFFKKLRQEAQRVHNPRYRNSRPNTLTADLQTFIRFFACGEYGSTTRRAHYHALLFGMWPQDATTFGKDTYTSPSLSELWKEGTHLFSPITPDRIAYVCGYTVKKMGTLRDRSAYAVVDPTTGEYYERQPEFSVMSRRPGVGAGWLAKYERDLRRGTLHHDGATVAIPRYYERKYQESHPEEVPYRQALRACLREERNPIEATKERLRIKEKVARARDEHYKPRRFHEL